MIATGSYTYDAAGHRTGVSGDLATFVQASGTDVTDATYNVNNQLTKWSGKTFTYDKNGNLTNDGVNTYTWDARGQLAAIAGGTAATFQYDSQRRRLARTVGGTTTAYAYDADNFVQELAGLGSMSTVNANLLTGGIDRTFLRSTGTGATAMLHWAMPEANNSTVTMTDSAGTSQKTYAYDPYGRTRPGAGTDTNSQQYTGRENDGTGLYYYRNRYYMPECMRFISEDPLGWASGQSNNYAYVGGDPINNTDPSGELGILGVVIGIGVEVGMEGLHNYMNGCSVLDYRNYNFLDIGLSGLLGAISPGIVTVGKSAVRAKEAAEAIEVLTEQLTRANTLNRASEIAGRIMAKQSTVSDAKAIAIVQGTFQAAKKLGIATSASSDGTCHQ